ncbi:16S rRNA (cytosine(1402)-N(4))-methyltransferase RsmH [Mesorhizobium sp. Z1-4]|uniref:16S rRNA (cytosine(1402)-N(4))-methyltransferase RsmH n=1 Tax=Mesorhizobium sp. Z1-4 TaxID=2448478 RepID=UPI000FDB6C6C|nr:16S rRNA (cytosine(1402)-N(4))-methyltransferase RsmH [Mesorhizobium sp. Z1-4]
MMAGPGADIHAGGGPARHIPVLLDEVVAALAPGEGQTLVDGTFGAGGYTRALLAAGAQVVAIDRDPNAIAGGAELVEASGGRLKLIHGAFADLDTLAGNDLDGVVLDIGVSSMQIDEAERGFSFRADGPLDMRMSGRGLSAADVVNTFKAGDIARILGIYGEERQAGRIARMIERKREERPFTRTEQLAHAIEAVLGRNPKEKIDPATRTFQALRIYVNDELGQLVLGLQAAERALKPGGRLAVVTFHSLEDRIVKRFFAARSGKASGSRHQPAVTAEAARFEAISKAVEASAEEIARNPRSRSAKLRWAVRTDASAAANREELEAVRIAGLPVASEAEGA